MTIAIGLKVGDCVVLGADSASTLADGDSVVNVYFNADKVVNLRKGLPIGAVTYGLGTLDSRSIATLGKDLRERLQPGGAWELDPAKYTVKEVVDRMREFFYEEHYKRDWAKPAQVMDPVTGQVRDVFPPMGFMIGGYSAGERLGELWILEIDQQGVCLIARRFAPNEFGVEAKGQPEALLRLVNGYSPRIYQGLVESGVAPTLAQAFLESRAMEPLVQAGMPLQDAIDLVQYFIEVTAGFVRFIPGAPSVHPPIDVAAISRHEGFRWVRRKHYFSAALNPSTP